MCVGCRAIGFQWRDFAVEKVCRMPWGVCRMPCVRVLDADLAGFDELAR